MLGMFTINKRAKNSPKYFTFIGTTFKLVPLGPFSSLVLNKHSHDHLKIG